MSEIAIEDVVKRIKDLPSLSAVVLDLLSSMEQEDVVIDSLAEKILLDQSLTVKTLRLANSSFYGMQSKVTTIQQAISVLGFHSIRTLVMACSVTGSFAHSAHDNFDFKAFWRHSVASAVCAKALARHLRINPDTAFTVGLLHDIGALVLTTRFPRDYAAMMVYRKEHDCAIIEAERAVFGLDHAMVGSALATYWRLPAPMQLAVASHHAPPNEDELSLALTVHVANAIAHGLDLSEQDDDLAPAVSERVWCTLALSDAVWQQVFRETEQTFKEICTILVN